MKDDVQQAIAEIVRTFPANRLEVAEEEQGGAWVIVHDLDIGDYFAPRYSWVGFGVQFQYPYSDVYPHYLTPDLAYADGRACGDPFQPNQLMPGTNLPATMLSRRSINWNPATDTAALKLQRVVDFLRRGAL